MPDIARQFVALPSPTAPQNPVGYHPCQGVYYTPAGDPPKTALIATHYNVDFSEHYLGPLMAERGFGFLGWNTRYRGDETHFILAQALIDIGVGVEWLRAAGVTTIVILGNSGGGSLMGAYQSQATELNLTPDPGMALPKPVATLPPADLYISLNAHPGRPEVLTAWLDPSVTDESDPVSVDPALDMYNRDNGPPYPDDFVQTYRAAQVARNHRITDWALAELDRMKAHKMYDRVFTLHRVWADLRLLDGALDPSDRPVGVCYAGNPRWANYSPFSIGYANTLRTWLSMWSLKTSQCRGAPHLKRIRVPSLVVQSLADTGVFPSDARAIYDHLGADEKELKLIPGAHYFEGPGDDRGAVADLVADWIRTHGG